MKLYLKGERCYSEKCGVDKRNYAPGQHGRRRAKGKTGGYGIQLREKQKVKRIYGVLERQFRRVFQKATRVKGVTGDTLMVSLERRLDNVVHRLGFASSRPQARQIVAHGHVLVNGKKIDVPSYEVKQGQEISLREKLRKNPFVGAAVEAARSRGIPRWLELDGAELKAKVVAMPTREDVSLPVQEKLIVELYSK
jgi:small subunit ribosomal protein S4